MLIDSKWLLRNYSISDNASYVIFQQGGSFVDYESADEMAAATNGQTHQWRYEHDELILLFNNGYSRYRGIVEGKKYTGQASNKDGMQWRFEADLLHDHHTIEQLELDQLIQSYKWCIKLYLDGNLTNPIPAGNERYIILGENGKVGHWDAQHQALPSTWLGSWVMLDNRVILRTAWQDGRYAAYIFVRQVGQLVGKAKDRAGRIFYFRALPYQRIEPLRPLAKSETNPFTNTVFNHQQVNSLGEYHKYWLIRDVQRNPTFDDYSNQILRLKDNLDWAVQRFYDQLSPLIIAKELCFCYVPSSTKEKRNTGIRRLAMKLAALHQRTDATACLIRTKTIPKAALGGERSREIQLDSLIINQATLIAGKTVILLDDVTTTGTSMEACRDLLLVAGAKTVYCLALGQTT